MSLALPAALLATLVLHPVLDGDAPSPLRLVATGADVAWTVDGQAVGRTPDGEALTVQAGPGTVEVRATAVGAASGPAGGWHALARPEPDPAAAAPGAAVPVPAWAAWSPGGAAEGPAPGAGNGPALAAGLAGAALLVAPRRRRHAKRP